MRRTRWRPGWAATLTRKDKDELRDTIAYYEEEIKEEQERVEEKSLVRRREQQSRDEELRGKR